MNCCRLRSYVSTCARREYGLGTGSCIHARSARVIAASAAALNSFRRGLGGGSSGAGGGRGREAGTGGGTRRALRFFGGAGGGATTRRFFFGGAGGATTLRFFFGGAGGATTLRFFFGGAGGGATRRFFVATTPRSLRRRVTAPMRALVCASLRPARRKAPTSCSRRRSKRSTVEARAFGPGIDRASKARSALVIAARAAGVGSCPARRAFFGVDAETPRRDSAADVRLLLRRAATPDHIMRSVASADRRSRSSTPDLHA